MVSGVLAGAMISRTVRTKKIMPAGIVSVLAVSALLYNGKKSYEWRYGL